MRLGIKNLQLIILFGSKARDRAGKISDTDIAALAGHRLTSKEKIKLIEWAAKELNVFEDKVDVVDISKAPPLLQRSIAENGKLLYGGRDDFIRFKVLAWKRYQNTAKFRRIREKVLEQRYK